VLLLDLDPEALLSQPLEDRLRVARLDNDVRASRRSPRRRPRCRACAPGLKFYFQGLFGAWGRPCDRKHQGFTAGLDRLLGDRADSALPCSAARDCEEAC
jgi:hypothetical protein